MFRLAWTLLVAPDGQHAGGHLLQFGTCTRHRAASVIGFRKAALAAPTDQSAAQRI
jgi:hypothetical protein